MRIEKIELKGIKSFDEYISVDFNIETNLFAFSGKNGAGKSTILKMPWLVQKAHFVSIMRQSELSASFLDEVSRYFSQKDAYVRLHLVTDKDRCSITLSRSKSAGYILSYENRDLIDKSWKLVNPADVILYVDASKGFSETTFKFGEINIEGNDKGNLAIEAILNPEQLFTHIYRQLVKDYVHNRLIPSKPDRLLYYHVASRMFTRLIPNVELKNFSGNHKPGEFVLLGKASRKKNIALYDVREFSSGEKALLSTLVFLCISRSVSTLIIDEPENHFHEGLLLEFMALLHRLCSRGGIHGWAKGEGGDLKLDWVEAEYADYNLNQVLVSTHSKPLIYKFFRLGENFVVDNEVKPIAYGDAEAILRQVGLSSALSKVLLVEGRSDNDALESALSDRSVTIKSLNGSAAVIETFSRLAQVREHLQHSTFVFLVDSDNKDESFFSDLRNINQEFYDSSFIRLDMHEFENYFLNAVVISKVVEHFVNAFEDTSKSISVDEAQLVLVRIAREWLPRVYKKELSLVFQQVIERHFAALVWGNKSFDWSDVQKVEEQLGSDVLTADASVALNNEMKRTAQGMFASYAAIDDVALLKRCDGKEVLSKVIAHFSQHIGVKANVFRRALYKACLGDADSDASSLRQKIIERLG